MSEQFREKAVVVLGAGFAGLRAARVIAGAGGRVVLVDRSNYHTFLPLLYQVAAAELESTAIAYPVRSIFRKLPGIEFVMDEAVGCDLENRVLQCRGGSLAYDYLVLSCGSTTHYFGVPGAREHAFCLKFLDEGMVLRNQILTCFEQASRLPEGAKRRRKLCFSIVGGGATGVEFAGALSELVQGPLAKDYPRLDFSEVRVQILEAGPRLLAPFSEKLGSYTRRRLEAMGVEVCTEAVVERVEAQAVLLKGGRRIETETVVWTAGVRGAPELENWGLPQTRGGRIPVAPTLQLPGRPEVYVAGDLAHLEEKGRVLPMVAPVAMQQGTKAGKNILRQMRGEAPEPFAYRDRGSMVTIGRNAAVAGVAGRDLTGRPAWLLWLFIHFIYIIGFRNRLLVLMNWAWDYLFFERVARLILPARKRRRPAEQPQSQDS